jgi:glycosyltransferase involved in cell wall biosynthesis
MTNAVIANSYATAGHLPCKSKTTVIHNGIDIEHYTPSLSHKASRAGFNLPEDVFILGMVGRLRPWKGQSRLLLVLKYVLEKHPHTQCIIVGGAPFKSSEKYIAQLHQLVRDLDLHDHVTFTGQLDDVRPALSAMDVFVHPGDPEPFGLVNIEAMAMAKPVVAFAHGALPEIVEHGKTGLLTPPLDEKAMAQAISELLNNPSQRNAMGTAGRRRVKQAFSITNTARAVDNVLNTIV